MPTCSVAECKNTNITTKGSAVKYHVLPKDNDLKNVWLDRCKIGDHVNTMNVRVCSAHFTDDDYKRDMEHELLGLPPRRLLKPIVIPTRNLPSPSCQGLNGRSWPLRDAQQQQSPPSINSGPTVRLTDEQARQQAKGIMKSALDRLSALSSVDPASIIAEYDEDEAKKRIREQAILRAKNDVLVVENARLNKANKRLKVKVTMLGYANEALKKKVMRLNDVLNDTISTKKKKLTIMESKCILVQSRLEKKCAHLQSELDKYMISTYLDRDAKKVRALKKLGEKSFTIRRAQKNRSVVMTSTSCDEPNGFLADERVANEVTVAVNTIFVPE